MTLINPYQFGLVQIHTSLIINTAGPQFKEIEWGFENYDSWIVNLYDSFCKAWPRDPQVIPFNNYFYIPTFFKSFKHLCMGCLIPGDKVWIKDVL